MVALVIASAIVTIYVTLYFIYNLKQISDVKNKNKGSVKGEEKSNQNKKEEKCLVSSIGSALLLVMSICATALIWALI